MSRIDEIKERASREEYVKHDIDFDEAQEDIEYLLSRLKLAETVLSAIAGEELPHGAKLINSPEDSAKIALEQLRE